MAKNKARKHVWANPELAAAMRELRRSSAATPHVPKPRKGTRKVQELKAIKDHLEG